MKTATLLCLSALFITVGLIISVESHAGDYGYYHYNEYRDRPYIDKYSNRYYDKYSAPYDKYSRGYDGLPFVNTEKDGLLKRDEQGRVTDEPYILPGRGMSHGSSASGKF